MTAAAPTSQTALRTEHLKLFLKVLNEMMAPMMWPRETLTAHQTAQFRAILAHAKTHSPWHAQRLRHLDPNEVTIADLQRVPVMNKNDLMENWDAIVTVPGASRAGAEAAVQAIDDEQFYTWGDHVVMSSGGTGGRPGLFVYDFEGLARLWASMARGFIPSLLPLRDEGIEVPGGVRLASLGGERSRHGSYVLTRIFSNPNNPTTALSGWRDSKDRDDKLNAADPHFFFSYPSLIAELCEAQNTGRLKLNPRALYFGGEHMPEQLYQLACKTWPEADVLTCWGTTEGGGSFACRHGGYHICEDMVVVEPVDEAGNPVTPGTLSAGIYFTNLFNKALPILRYTIDDVFEMETEPCPCGSHFAKVRQVHGRHLDRFRYGDITILPATFELAALEQANILEYQVQETPKGVHFVYTANRPVDEERVRRRMRESFASLGLPDAEVTIAKLDSIARTKAGKLPHYLPRKR